MHRDRTAEVYRTLPYVDGVNFARRAHAPAHLSVGLLDGISPASTVFAAYNNYAVEKELAVWPHNGHEGGGHLDDLSALRHFGHVLG